MILPDNKEITEAVDKVCKGQGTYQVNVADKSIVKATGKKIYEWGEEQCQGHHTSGIWFKRRECTKCWQELLKECE